MALKAPEANLTAREGITFGGAAITPSGWDGHWSRLAECKDDRTTVLVPPASALVVRLQMK